MDSKHIVIKIIERNMHLHMNTVYIMYSTELTKQFCKDILSCNKGANSCFSVRSG